MRNLGAIPLLLSAAFVPVAFAAPEGWHASLDDGVKAAKKGGRPVLAVTMWPPRV